MDDLFSNLTLELTKEQLEHLIRRGIEAEYPDFSVKSIRFSVSTQRDMRGEEMGSTLNKVVLSVSPRARRSSTQIPDSFGYETR